MDAVALMSNSVQIKDICRTCLLQKGEMQCLFGACLADMLTDLTAIKIGKDDGLPNLICLQCILQLSKAYNFKQACEKSDKTLKLFVSPEFQREQYIEQNLSLECNKAIKSEVIKSEVVTLDDCPLLCPAGPDDGYMGFIDSAFPQAIHITEVSSLPSDVIDLEQAYFMSTDCQDSKLLDDKPSASHLIDKISLNDEDKKSSLDDVIVESVLELSEMDISLSDTTKFKINCKQCDEQFDTKTELKIHMIDHPNVCKTCGKTFTLRRSLVRHLQIHLEKRPHTCNTCQMSFADLSNLKKHIKKHTGELRNIEGKPYLCSVCGRSFKWATSLTKHFNYHTGHKLFTCEHCPKQYVESRSLNIHMRRHTGERPFDCSVCSQRFTQQCNLDKHMRIHTGEKPFKCSICGKGFSQKGYVRTHMRSHTGDKPFICRTCGRGFAGINTLKNHNRTHTGEKPFSCKVCRKIFSRQEAVVVHMRSHTGQRPHVCHVCTKGFLSSGHLKAHIRSHTGEKPFMCELCNKRFVTNSSLKIHSKTHTKEKLFRGNSCDESFTDHNQCMKHHLMHVDSDLMSDLSQQSVDLKMERERWELDSKNVDMDSHNETVNMWVLDPSTPGAATMTTEVAARTIPITQWNITPKSSQSDSMSDIKLESDEANIKC